AFVRRTRATLRSAELGFLGVCVYTRMHTPRFSGQPANAGDFVLLVTASRPMRTNCENVGTVFPLSATPQPDYRAGHFAPPPGARTKLRERSEEHTSELSHVAISYAVFCLKKKKK